MATSRQISVFISEIAPYAQKAYLDLGKVLPSVCIGMACVECAYGTAGSVKYHSYLGFKVGSGKTATKYWPGRFFRSKTREEYTIGVHTVIEDAFRAYDSMEQCVYNFYELLNTSRYARVLSGMNYEGQMAQIKACGYMTSSTEVSSVCSIIRKYGLTLYDRLPDSAAGAAESDRNPAPYSEPVQAVRYGTKGNDARWVQFYLNRHGYGLIVDGIIGKKSEAAIVHFQWKNGLLVDGIAGAKTRARLKEAV